MGNIEEIKRAFLPGLGPGQGYLLYKILNLVRSQQRLSIKEVIQRLGAAKRHYGNFSEKQNFRFAHILSFSPLSRELQAPNY